MAVKTVIISASQERRKRALHEAALCQSIVHPNIIVSLLWAVALYLVRYESTWVLPC